MKLLGRIILTSLFLCQYLVYVQGSVDGGYSQWGAWTQCASCADQRSRSRTCTNPPSGPSGGMDCSGLGPDSETEECNSRFCSGECSVAVEHRVLCVSRRATAQQCNNLGCCWDGDDTCFYGKSQEYKGCSEAKLAKRIVGGQEADVNEYPRMLLLKVSTKQYFCGASLIAPSWVLTAQHCVDGHSPPQIGIAYGIHDNYQDNNVIILHPDFETFDRREQKHAISKIIKHPSYSSRSLDYDFALMKLTKTVIMNDHVRAICLPKSTKKLPVGTVCWETAWERTSHNGKMSDYLKELEVVIVDPRKTSLYGVHSTMFITESKTEVNGTCHVDSGGPVVCEENGIWYLEGVHSWGPSDCAQKGHYDGQADVRVVLPWIIETIMNN